MDTKILEEIGLTHKEIDVYLALLEQGPSTAGKILEKADIQNSVFHFCIKRLISKGLVSYIKKGIRKVYKAADPEQFLTYIKDKENDVKKILPLLKERQYKEKERHEVEMFEGWSGVTTALNITLKDAKRGDDFLFFAVEDQRDDENIRKFYLRLHAKRVDKGVISKGIAPKILTGMLDHIDKIKYVDYPLPQNMAVCNDKICIITWDEKPRAVLITSEQIARKEAKFFNTLWGR